MLSFFPGVISRVGSVVLGAFCVALPVTAQPVTPPPSAVQELSIGVYEYPPFLGKALVRGGVLADLSHVIFREAGYRVHQRSMPFARVLAASRAGQVDVVVGLWHTLEREQHFLFSRSSLLSTPVGFYKRKDASIPFPRDGQLNQLIVGMPRGYALPAGFDLSGLQWLPLDDDYQTLKLVARGRVDLALISRDVADFLFKEHLAEQADQVEMLGPALGVQHFYMAVSRNHCNPQQVIDDFERVLMQLWRQGRLQAIIRNHGFEVFPPVHSE